MKIDYNLPKLPERFTMKIILSILVMVSALFAAQCEYIRDGGFGVEWTAYKTPLKVPVSGSFNQVGTQGNAMGKTLNDILSGSKVKINSASVNTQNPERDATLVKSFFRMLKNGEIGASAITVDGSDKEGVINSEITMNGVTKKVPLKYTFNEEHLVAKGFIDLLDFAASGALSSINKACYDLHEGKTWSDVEITLKAKISKRCK